MIKDKKIKEINIPHEFINIIKKIKNEEQILEYINNCDQLKKYNILENIFETPGFIFNFPIYIFIFEIIEDE